MTKMKLSLTLLMISLVAAPAAYADGPATVGVRIEGATTTLFEGPLRSAGNPVRGASDTQQRHCDGTNNSAHGAPGATATGAAAEGLRLTGQDFDAKWFPGFDDYYVTRFGPDAENVNTFTYWGLLVDDAFTDVGGCQKQVADGNRVLWAYDAFHDRGFLKLAAAGDVGVTPQPTATVTAGQPLTVRVTRAYGEKNPVFAPAGGMTVAPVSTAANGTQSIQTASPQAVTTSPTDGTADVVFSAPGWQRLKAEGGPSGPIRSNRLDVCVVAAPGGSCGAPPADTLVREAAPLPPDPIDPGVNGGAGSRGGGAGGSKSPGGAIGAPVIELPRFTAMGRARGRIGVSWRVLNAGVGVKSWRLESRAAGARSSAWTVRAKGTKKTAASLSLPAGRSWSVRATFVDMLNRSVSQTIGDVLVPVDAGARRGVRRSGRWTRKRDTRAWLGAVHRGRSGTALTVKLTAGKPVVLVRGVRKSADIEVRAGGRTAVYRVSGSTTTQTREIVAASRKASGSVRVRIVRGEAGIDGVGVRP